jgi:hypothetical protein
MSISPERFCLGGLMKEIDKEYDIEEIDSKNDTLYKSSIEQNFSSNDSKISSTSSNSIFFPGLETPICLTQKNEEKSQESFTKENILNSFKNQKLTKQLQKYLYEIPKETIDNIIKELSGTFRTIIKNRNGNYFCSDLLKVCNNEQRIIILKELSNTLNEDCIDEFGTHPIQNLIELSSSDEEYKLLLSSFSDFNKILMASLNQNGAFVIQKLIVYIPEKMRTEFNNMFIKLICILSRDMYGVCTVKKFIGYTKNEIIVKQVLNVILTNFANISGNQYGNYLIQYLLERWWKTSEGVFLKKMITLKFQTLLTNHYSCYICDLFIKLCNQEEKKIILSSLNNYKIVGKNNNFKNKTSFYLNKITKDFKEESQEIKS